MTVDGGANNGKVIGVNELRPKLGKYLDEAEKGETFVISSRSKLKGVLLSYSKYRGIKRTDRKKQSGLKFPYWSTNSETEPQGRTDREQM